jgi:hypothetical protein
MWDVFEGVRICIVFVDGVESRRYVGGYRLWAVGGCCRRVIQLVSGRIRVGSRVPFGLQLAVAFNVLMAMLKLVRG